VTQRLFDDELNGLVSDIGSLRGASETFRYSLPLCALITVLKLRYLAAAELFGVSVYDLGGQPGNIVLNRKFFRFNTK
jgi:hypothetical protein